LPWSNSILLRSDAADSVAQLKRDPIGDLTIMGCDELIQSLVAADLIDEYLLMIHPIVVGAGRRLFAGGTRTLLRLVDSITDPGVVMATYERPR